MSRSTELPGRFIPFARPSIGPEEESAVVEVLRSGWLTTGSRSAEFEARFAEFVGASYAIALSSGTAGLHLALEAIGVSEGDRVVTTPYTFTATAETIRYLGADPLFVDICEESYNIDPSSAAEAVRAHNPRGIVVVHIAGEPCDMDTLTDISRNYGVALIEDAAHAFPSLTSRGYLGTIGDAGVFSFYANKPITTGEGGMVVTDDDQLAERIRIMRLHGIDRSVWDRYLTARPKSWDYDVVEAGYKYNLPDVAAAIGLAQLGRARSFLELRTAVAKRYTEAFAERDYLIPPRSTPGHAWHLYILRLRPERLRIGRDEYIERLAELGVGVSVHYKPLHHMSYYRKRYGLTPGSFPRATDRFENVMSLPIYPDLDAESVDRVVEAVLAIGDASYCGRRTT